MSVHEVIALARLTLMFAGGDRDEAARGLPCHRDRGGLAWNDRSKVSRHGVP